MLILNKYCLKPLIGSFNIFCIVFVAVFFQLYLVKLNIYYFCRPQVKYKTTTSFQEDMFMNVALRTFLGIPNILFRVFFILSMAASDSRQLNNLWGR